MITSFDETKKRKFPLTRFFLAVGIVVLHLYIFFPRHQDNIATRTPFGMLYAIAEGPLIAAEEKGPVALFVLFGIFYLWEVVCFIWLITYPSKKIFFCFAIPWILWTLAIIGAYLYSPM